MKQEEKLKEAQRLYETANADQRYVLESLFPELKESEDEKIRKSLIELFKDMEWDDSILHDYNMDKDKTIAWLEKQGEQKSTDKVEPKFHIGDWIIKGDVIAQIIDVKEKYYIGVNIEGEDFTASRFLSDNKMHLWTIKDAKDGDVLCYKDEISLYKHDIKNYTKEETTFGGFVYHCCYDGKRFIMDSLYSLTEQDKMDIHPATKEQRDLLSAKMKEAGYEWNVDKKELKKLN